MMKLNKRAQDALENTKPSDIREHGSKEEFFDSLGIGSSESGKCIVKVRLPAQYLGEKATEDQIKSVEMYKHRAKQISEDGYGVIILPALTDSDGNYLFDMEIIKV